MKIIYLLYLNPQTYVILYVNIWIGYSYPFSFVFDIEINFWLFIWEKLGQSSIKKTKFKLKISKL